LCRRLCLPQAVLLLGCGVALGPHGLDLFGEQSGAAMAQLAQQHQVDLC